MDLHMKTQSLVKKFHCLCMEFAKFLLSFITSSFKHFSHSLEGFLINDIICFLDSIRKTLNPQIFIQPSSKEYLPLGMLTK